MGQGRPPGTTVFVGNISYDTTEDQLREVFSQVGNVVSFRLMYDHETGRAKGFGFCEYEDKETAMSARRNLNGTTLNGRPLRVDLTESDKQNAHLNGLALTPPPAAQTPASSTPAATPAHPALPPSLASANPSMASMSLPDIHRTMLHLKKAVVQNPNEMRELLLAHPRLAHAILQGQIMLGMVPPPMPPPPNQAQRPPARIPPPRPHVQRSPQNRPVAQQPRMPMQRPPMQRPPQQMPPPPPQPMPPPQQMPPQMGVPPRPMVGPTAQGVANGVPPVMMNAGAMGAMRIGMQPQGRMGQQTVQGMAQVAADEQQAILRRVMTMSQQEIDELTPEHREYVLQLKEIVNMSNTGLGGGMGGPMGGGIGGIGQGMTVAQQQGQGPPLPPPPPQGQFR